MTQNTADGASGSLGNTVTNNAGTYAIVPELSSSPPAPPKQEDLCFYAPTPPKAMRDMWTPPALRRNARGWQSGEGAVWQGWRAPAFFPGA